MNNYTLRTYALQMTMALGQEQLSDDDDEKEDGAVVVLDVIEDTVELVGCAGFLAAALAHHVDPKITYAGLAVWGVCFVVAQGLGLPKISLWGKMMLSASVV
ncbi:hypothetical protein B0T26DRAFT_750282 [Lasiosphaeria miniovina]|uniref:Uncharacterized protein n=1 Tax=Lasiosphaeria miniovina TaxID=1954250 RepID=A0AA40E0Y1_9PEZI|nr:uncharacterized protein B0T26DRAFT_750282 [Lasiosphaeria miniovina]KAK0722945.1 hypothetical protein B0T26DRAFT_750282 [Lasiosphaeria miniovina]